MATSYTSLLGLALPDVGELNWGGTVNNEITSLLDSAVSGTTTLTSDVDVVLSTTSGVLNEARQAILLWNPTVPSTTTRYITAPARSKPYIVINRSGSAQTIVLRGVGPTTGISVVQNEACVAAWNGIDFVKVSSNIPDGVTTVSFGSTGLTPNSPTSGAVTVAGTLAVANGGTGQTTANAAFNALAPSQGGNNGKYLKTDGSNTSWDALDISTADITGTLPVANGGTGQTTATEAFDALAPTTTLGDTIYRGASDNLRLAGNTTTTKNFLSQTGTGSVSAAPAWSTVTKSDVGLSNVENTAISTWTGSTNIASLGTVTAGTWNASTIGVGYGGTGQTSFANGELLIGNSTGNTLTKATLTAGSGVTITNSAGGITIAATGSGGTVTSVTASTPLASSGGATPNITLGTVGIANGGTGQTTANAAFNALAPSQTSNNGKYLKTDGSNTSWDALDISTADITGTLPIANGGTGQTTATLAFNALSPVTTLGDIIYRDATDNVRLAGNTTATKQFLSQTGTGSVSAAPSWSAVSKSDVGLSNVENTALSTWAGSSNITTVGTLSSLTASGAVSFSTSTDNLNLGTSQTTGTTTIGGASQTGAITIGQATGNQTVNIATGTLVPAATKTINVGTGGTTGNTTQINVGNLTSRVDVAGKLSINNTGAVTADFNVFGSTSLGVTTISGAFSSTNTSNSFGPITGSSTGVTNVTLFGRSAFPTTTGTRFAHTPTGVYTSDFEIQEQTGLSTFTTRIWLLSGGNFGIGVSPSYKLDVNGTARFSGGAATPPVAVAFSATAMTVNCALSNVFTTTFTASVTSAPTISNPQDGQTINWFITQDGTGGRTMTWPTSFKWPGGTPGVLSTGANAVDLVTATYRSSNGFWYATLLKAFS